MALHLPSTLKLTQLKHLAFKCGIPTTGTKPILLSRLHHEITTASPPPSTIHPVRILSIDMGIRNLAYCILDVPPKSPKESQLPILQSWHRLAVSSAPAKRNPSSETRDDEAVVPPTKEAFDPATLSTAAYTLLRKRLLTQIPTNVLIERQRFRSMGSKHILEWTVRVNMFECILYAVLHTLKAEGAWSGNVIPVTPGKVGPFWVGEDIAEDEGRLKGKQRTSKSSKIRNKGAKIDLVRKWLEGGEMVRFGNEDVEAMARAYREKWDRAPGGRKGVKRGEVSEEEKMGKLDDLADCLLQGMAWVQWEENKRFALKHGIDTLLDP